MSGVYHEMVAVAKSKKGHSARCACGTKTKACKTVPLAEEAIGEHIAEAVAEQIAEAERGSEE